MEGLIKLKKSKQKEKIYDCTNDNEYKEFIKVCESKYNEMSILELKNERFKLELSLNKVNQLDVGVVLTYSIAIVSLLFNWVDIAKDRMTFWCTSISVSVIFILLIYCFYEYINSYKIKVNKYNMKQVEIKYIDELIQNKLSHAKTDSKKQKKR